MHPPARFWGGSPQDCTHGSRGGFCNHFHGRRGTLQNAAGTGFEPKSEAANQVMALESISWSESNLDSNWWHQSQSGNLVEILDILPERRPNLLDHSNPSGTQVTSLDIVCQSQAGNSTEINPDCEGGSSGDLADLDNHNLREDQFSEEESPERILQKLRQKHQKREAELAAMEEAGSARDAGQWGQIPQPASPTIL